MFSVLLDIGEQEGWITAHVSSVRVTTPYDNDTVIMHEGASGGGKSEMCQELHHEDDGRMAVADAEASWFVRVDNLRRYGENVDLERAIIHPSQRLVLFSIEGVPDTTALRWEHVLDSTGEPCPNPRVVIPRAELPGVLSEPEPVDVRTFCVRMPACTKDKPTYGIMGMTHFEPPSIAWLWRLIAPRGAPSASRPTRCAPFGNAPIEVTLDGQPVRRTLLRPEMQSWVGEDAYDEGCRILSGFFRSELRQFLTPDLDPLGREIIETCLRDGSVEDHNALTPMYL